MQFNTASSYCIVIITANLNQHIQLQIVEYDVYRPFKADELAFVFLLSSNISWCMRKS